LEEAIATVRERRARDDDSQADETSDDDET
jgi:hypothetical protein